MNSQITKYDLSTIRNLTKNNSEMFNKMIDVFICNSTNEFNNISDALINNDIIKVKAIVHKIKPSLDYLLLKDFSKELTLIKSNLESSNNFEQAKSEFYTLKKMLTIINANLQKEVINAN